VARVLKPGGLFVQTFSNRWFPPKVVKIWPELHEFERLGLVLEYFLRTGAFGNLKTFSSRGWPRPETDRYFPQLRPGRSGVRRLGRKDGLRKLGGGMAPRLPPCAWVLPPALPPASAPFSAPICGIPCFLW
jgi:hypothetical protein